MASLSFEASQQRWRVRWYDERRRRTKRFDTREEAASFAERVGGASHRRGPAADPLTPDGVRSLIKARSSLHPETECWIWTAKGGSNGYANFTRRVNGRVVSFSAHRLSYAAFKGEIPDGLHIDHLCVTPKCVNPEHLEAVTPQENIRRRDARKVARR